MNKLPHVNTAAAAQLAWREKIGMAEAFARLAKEAAQGERPNWKGGAGAKAKDASLSRFGTHKPDGAAIDLKENHPALSEGRTIFPSTVVTAMQTDRLLVSGHNNPKLGAEIRKGPWTGFPIYHLTLEERATCPRSCALWAGCYGNAMHMARRHDHRSEDFLLVLELELRALSGRHPAGFAVRLHTLGDFYSIEYVSFWARMLDEIAALHVFGFSAYGPWSEDDREHAIGEALEALSHAQWDRFAIRFSGWTGFQGAMVVDSPPPPKADTTAIALWDATQAGADRSAGDKIIMCPAQTGATAACATCGLCWAEAARTATIGFLKHGMKGGRKPLEVHGTSKDTLAEPEAPHPGLTRHETWAKLRAEGVPSLEIARRFGVSPASISQATNGKSFPRIGKVPTPAPKDDHPKYMQQTPRKPYEGDLTPKVELLRPRGIEQPPPMEERGVKFNGFGRPKKLGISPEEQDRLIREALANREVTKLPSAGASGVGDVWGRLGTKSGT